MNRVILQPSGSPDAREHYKDTIDSPVRLDLINSFVDEFESNILKNIYSESAYVWGVTPGKNLSNKNKWNKMQSGDICLFSRLGYIFASGTVTHKIHNKNLALELWKTDKSGATWEYIFFLDEIKQLKIPYSEFNIAVGYKVKNVIQGFDVLDEIKSDKVINTFNLRSQTHLPKISEDEYEKVLKFLQDDNLNKEVKTYARKEQAYLRKKLFNYKSVAHCGICNNEYNISFLVCAHIKKRSKCSNEEMKNIHNVMPMCKFGCDELFEKGYITLHNGKVNLTYKKNVTSSTKKYLDSIKNNQCRYYNNRSKDFFEWHSIFHHPHIINK